MLRTHNCGQLRLADNGQSVTLAGWVQSCRNLGGLLFIALRDHDGLTQLVIDLASQPSITALAQELRDEFVINFRRKAGVIDKSIQNIHEFIICGIFDINVGRKGSFVA